MFSRVLVVEDLDTVGYGISMMLQKELGVNEVVLTQYCDEAYLKFKKALLQNKPFELLITDLSFVRDHRPLTLNSGRALIEKIREQGHNIPIIVCTVDEKPAMVKQFVNEHKVASYILKGRDGLKDLKTAVSEVFAGRQFFSEKIERVVNGKSVFEIQEFDVSLLQNLSEGLTQDQISVSFKTNGITPNSLSTIEKRLNKLKDILKAKNNVQLIAIAKDLDLI
ncbi:response regulator [Flagellimonas myxillae]|uniref:response regulator n=1 Tax=Flagellimonas myxillae TaxID=2942214 RepID=UPI00201ED868|nr:response regulator [Muricauda myxillae]MCL6265048.1 response regulator [Muricauda myxillae]